MGCALADVPFFSNQNVLKSTENMTNTYCAELANEAEYTYFGTYVPGECLGFADTPPLRWRSNSTDCSTPCVGNNTQMCGGSSSAKRVEFISVYRVPVGEESADLLGEWDLCLHDARAVCACRPLCMEGKPAVRFRA